MERGKRVMQPEADFDLNKEPPESEEECKRMKNDGVSALEAELDHMIIMAKEERECYIEELKKLLKEYIDENEMRIKTERLQKNNDVNLLWESIRDLKKLVNLDPQASSSQSVLPIEANKKN